jgi:hypothetical protein
MSRIVRKLGGALAGAVLVVTGGCADAPEVLRPPADPASFNGVPTSEVKRLARFDTRPQITIAWAKAWIGPAGGRVDFHGFAIEVPPGAVDRVTMFSIRLPVDPTGSDHVVAEFGPHGATFARPVAIELPFARTSIAGSERATVVWWNGGWVDMGGEVTADGLRLRTLTDHFSTYGTTERGGGSIAVSGG